MDALARDAGAEAAAQELAIRVRFQLSVLHQGQYTAWPGVSWVIEFAAHEQVTAFRDAMTTWMVEWAKTQNQ